LAAKEAQNIAQNHTLDKEVRAYERLYKKLVK
jgi:hypothetical protein